MASTAVELPPAPPEAQLYVDPKTNGVISWTEFTENTTFHGIKYIFQKSSNTLRRPVWLMVVVTSLLVFVVQVSIRIGDFFKYKTFVDVGVTYNDSLQFPAVTICNQNSFRMTATAGLGLYDVIDGVFKETNISRIPWGNFNGKESEVDYQKFLNTTGHQKLLLIDSCEWKGEICNTDLNFKAVITDLGLCYTFDTNNGIDLKTTETGADAGLKLVLNVEQYEYMRGPQSDAGVMILLHPAGEMPIMGEHGFAAAPGTHTLVAIKRSEVGTLEPPYGLCHPSNIPINQCHAQCRGKEIINRCGCYSVNVRSDSGNTTVACNFKSSLSCTRKALAEMKRSKLACICNPPCLQVRYESELSYAQLSKFNIDRTILDNPDKQAKLQERYTMARETAHRFIEELKARDDFYMSRVVDAGNTILTWVGIGVERVKDQLSAAKHFNLPPIFLLEPIQDDFNEIGWHVSNAHWKLNDSFAEKYTNLLSYLNNIKSEFKKSSPLNTLLQSCMDKAGEADFGAPFTAEENVTLKYGSQECMDGIVSRAETFKEQRASCEHHFDNVSDFNQALSEYQRFLDDLFEDTDKTADDVADHLSCLQFLKSGETLSPEFSAISSLIDTFVAAENIWVHKSTADDIAAITEFGNIKNAILNLSLCDWPEDILLESVQDYQDLKSFIIVKIAEVNAEALTAFETLTQTMVAFNRDYKLLIQPLTDKVADYIDQRATMTDVVSLINGRAMVKRFVDMEAFRTNAYTLINHVEDKLDKYRFNLEPIYKFVGKSLFPLMTTSQIKDLEFFKEIAATNRLNYLERLDRIVINATLNIEELFELIFTGYMQELSDVVNVVVEPIQSLVLYMDELKAELTVFEESIELNANFFMDNFLQVDIFYRDMSYEVISQQKAFEPLSLLGEIGGFMGLLLGASVITVCELLDYVFMNIIRVCIQKHRMKSQGIEVAPAANSDTMGMSSVKT